MLPTFNISTLKHRLGDDHLMAYLRFNRSATSVKIPVQDTIDFAQWDKEVQFEEYFSAFLLKTLLVQATENHRIAQATISRDHEPYDDNYLPDVSFNELREETVEEMIDNGVTFFDSEGMVNYVMDYLERDYVAGLFWATPKYLDLFFDSDDGIDRLAKLVEETINKSSLKNWKILDYQRF
jgi:hypothetical protein